MNTTAKKLVSAILASLLLISFTSCGSKDKDGEETQATTTAETTVAETEEPKILPDLPEITYEGRDFTFYQYENGEGYPKFSDIWVEAQSGEPIDDAVSKRNSFIQEKYDIKIVFKTDPYVTFEGNVAKYAKANQDVFEVMIPMGHCIPRMYTNGVFYNLHDVPHLDFDKPWWDSEAVESFTLAGYMPFGISDLTINDKGVTAAVYFNKKLAEDYNVNIDFYDVVNDGTWTMQMMVDAGKKVCDDLDGDTDRDSEDRYGIAADDYAVVELFHAAGCRHITKDSDGYPQAAFESEYNYTAIKWYLDTIMFDENLTHNRWQAGSLNMQQMFEKDRALFMFGQLGTALNLREMTSDYGIIPVPKYLESQEGYAATVSTHAGALVAVPRITKNVDMIGVILEAISAESHYTLIPAFYETVLKDKMTRDERSVDMLDIIINSMVFDVGEYYCIGNYQDPFMRITGNVKYAGLAPSYPEQTSDIASFYAKYGKQTEKAIEKLIEIIDEWNAE